MADVKSSPFGLVGRLLNRQDYVKEKYGFFTVYK